MGHFSHRLLIIAGILGLACLGARAASYDQCIIALDPSASGALSISGSVDINAAACGTVVDSSNSAALKISGSAKLTAKYIDVVGGYSRSGSSTLTPTPQTQSPSLPNPLTFLVPPSIGQCDHTNFSVSGSGSSTLNPGVYCNGISISGSNNVTFNPGTYILAGGGLKASGSGTLSGTGVTFFLSQNGSYSYGPLSVSGSIKMNLAAPTAIASPYYGILFYQDPAIGTGKAASSISGSSDSTVEGVFYFPTTALSYSGSSQSGNYLILVADTLNLTGSVDINGNFPNSRSPLEPPVSVAITPLSATVYPAQTLQFTAVISNSSQGIVWSLSPSTSGTISATGLYTAPSTVTSQQIVTVTVTSLEDPTKSASAVVTLSPPISVTVAPPAVTLYGGQTQQFSATVNNASNTAVTWSASAGTINANGLYTAPPNITTTQTATITATSQADNRTTGTAIVTLSPPISVSVAPATVTLFGAQTQQFSATVNNAINKAVTWTLTPATGAGTINGSGLYIAPTSITTAQTVTVTALSQADNMTIGTATVSLSPPTSKPLVPATASLTASQTQQFAATLPNNTSVTWSISPSGLGTISPTGQYVAPSCITTQQTVTVTATGVQDSTQTGTATVTLLVSSNVYAYSRAITVSHTLVSRNQTDFPLLISGTYGYLATAANGGKVQNSNGYDIIFTDATGASQLDHEIESYNPATGQIVAWVRIPLLSSTTDTVINMWYGNSSVTTSQANPSGVWDSNYDGVYHFTNGVTLSGADSTGNNYLATLYDAAATSGQMDGAAQLNGTNSYIGIPAAAFQSYPSFEVWIKTSGTGVIVGETDGTLPNGTPAPDGWAALLFIDSTGHIRATGPSESPNPNGDITGPIVNDGQWHLITYNSSFSNNIGPELRRGADAAHVLAAFHPFASPLQGSNLNLYVDGQLVGSSAFSGGFQSATSFSYFLGTGYLVPSSQPGSWNYLAGTIDEFRVFANGLPIPPALEYQAESAPASFYSVSAESTTAPGTLLVEPVNAFLGPSQTQQYAITSLGACLAAANWSVTPAGTGTISSAGLYTAPATITGTQTVTITAANPSNPSVTGIATVNLAPTSVNVTPVPVTLYAGQTQQFTAAVTNGNTAVTWSLSASAPGSISTTGLYTAPSTITSQQSLFVTATSQADNTASGSALVTLEPPVSVSVGPSTAVAFAGQSLLFTASVANANNTAVTWSISPAGAGAISGSGFYSAPATLSSPQTVTVTATSIANPSVSASATITLTAASFFTYNRAIVIDHTKVPNTDQTNFPVLVSGTYSYLATAANGGKVQNPNGYDIVFTSDCAGLVKLNHEIESYNPATGQIVAWVNLPTVSHSTDTVFYMWYGNSSIAVSLANPTKVWDSNYFTVLHLGLNGALSVLDSTANANNGFNVNATGTPGLIGEAAFFNGSAEINLSPSLSGYQQFTLSTWLNATGTGLANPNNYFFLASPFGLQFATGNGVDFVFNEDNTISTNYLATSTAENLNDGQWHYAVGSFDGSSVYLYIDGQLNASTPVPAPNYFLSSFLFSLGQSYIGDLQEARVSTTARSADWTATEYNNQFSPATFYTIYGENATAFIATPATATLFPSQTEQIGTTLVGICSNPTVTFTLSPSGVGTLSSSGLYTTPASIPTQQTVTITATAQTNPPMTASATIILQPPVPVAPVSVALTPAFATLYQGNTLQFAAAVANTTNTGVTWSLTPSGMGGISSTGLYTSPTTITATQTVTVTATSQANPTISATATITLAPGAGSPVTSSPFGSALSLVADSLCRRPDTAPTVTVSNDQFTTLASSGTASVTVAGVVSNYLFDDPGQALTYGWSLVSGPSPVQFAAANAASTQVTFTAAGTYTLQLNVSDGVTSTVGVTHVIVSPAVDTTNVLYLTPSASGPNATNTNVSLQVTTTNCGRCQVQITVTGANPSTATVALDNSSHGQFVYAGLNPGTDTVVASYNGLMSNAVAVTWIAAPALITSSPVTGQFFGADGSGVFNTAASQMPVFTQIFPNIDFNPAAGTVPGNTSTVSILTRPFTDIVTDSAGNFQGTVPAQGNDYQAGAGPLYSFSAVFTGSFNVPAAGQVTFTFSDDDAFVFGVGNGALRVSGPQINTPANTTFQNYPVMGGVNQRTAPVSNSITVNFPAAGVFPYEVDYAKGGDSNLTLTMLSNGIPVPAAALLTMAPSAPTAATTGQIQSFVVSAASPGGVALPNLPITVNVAGVNAQVRQLTTDGTGKISFAYEGSTFFPGVDQIQATATISGVPIYSNLVQMTWNTGVNQAPVVSAGSPQTISLPAKAILTGTVTDDGLPNNTLTITWSMLSGPGTVTFDDASQAATAASFSMAGDYVLQLSAYDGALTTTSTVAITVNINTNLTTGWIQSPVEGSSVSGQVPVTLIPGITLVSGTLTYFSASNQTAVVTISSDTTGSGQVGTFDATLLNNGGYFIILNATNSQGQTMTSQVYVTANGDYKPGRVTATITDLTVPAPGLPIQIQRTYDSLVRSTSSDFGFGWKLGVNIQTEVSPTGDVTLTLNGRRRTFFFTPPANSVFTFYYTPLYTPEPGLYGSLVTTGDNCFGVLSHVGNVWQCGVSLPPAPLYQPNGYVYTDPSGRQYTMDANGNLQSVKDLNGNTVTITSGGILSSNGLSVPFVRDSQGRITQITDTLGNEYLYAYDTSGDLTSVTYPGISTPAQYGYDSSHLLTLEKDRNGITAGTSTYYPDGKLQSVTDAVGNTTQYAYNVATNTTTVTNPDGGTVVTVADSYGDPLTVTDPLGRVTTNTYDANHNLLTTTDPLGKTTTYTYNSNGFRTSQTDPLSDVTAAVYNAVGGPTSVADPLKQMQNIAYDSNFNISAITDSIGQVAAFTYNAQALPLTAVDARGNTTSYTYDQYGNKTSSTDPLQRTTTYAYDTDGNLSSQTDPRGNKTQYVYDAFNRKISMTDALGNVTKYAYNGNNNLISQTDALNRVTSFTYDAANRQTQITYPDNTTKTFTYDFRGNKLTEIDQLGRVSQYVYDLAGQLTSTTVAYGTPDAATTSYIYDLDGRKVTQTDPRGNKTSYAYDAAGRMTSTTDAIGNVTSDAYDAKGQRTSMTDAKQRVTSYTYDARGRQLTTTTPDSRTVTKTYDGLGNVLTVTDEENRTTTYAYDAVNQLTTVTDALNEVTQYGYDLSGNKTSQTDANSHSTQYVFDALNRRTSRTLPAGQSESYTYDAVGNKATHVDFNGKTTTFGYDSLNRLLTRTPDPFFNAAPISFTYTATGKRLSMTDPTGTTNYTYSNRDQVLTKATPQGTLTYTYDLSGNEASVVSSNANGTGVAYAWDADNRLSSVTDNRTSGVTNYSYDQTSQLSSTQYPNGVAHAFTYDDRDRPINLNITGPLGLSLTYAQTFSPSGRKTNVTEQTGRDANYGYSSVYRLLSESISGDPTTANNGALSYVLDPVGNRTSLTSTLAVLLNQTFGYDADDRLTSDTYDANGNTLTSGGHSYSYDFEDRLTQLDSSVQMSYDGDGNRIVRTASGTTTRYLVDDLTPTGYPQVAEEVVNSAVVAQFTYGSRRISQNRSGVLSYYGYDGGASVRELFSDTGAVTDTYAYDAFGNTVAQSGSTVNEFLYRGEQFDPLLGVYYLRVRYYQPQIGRFLTSDKYEGDVAPGVWTRNMYDYAAGDPVNGVDPRGLQSFLESGTLYQVDTQVFPAIIESAGEAYIEFGTSSFFNLYVAPFCKVLVALRAVSGQYSRGLGIPGWITAGATAACLAYTPFY